MLERVRGFTRVILGLALAGCRAGEPSSAPEPGPDAAPEPWLVISEPDQPPADVGKQLERRAFTEGPDGDADGVVDEFDVCPGVAEDDDGFQDDDGCPEADNDQDGILDVDDACPNEPETFDGRMDEDGCPG